MVLTLSGVSNAEALIISHLAARWPFLLYKCDRMEVLEIQEEREAANYAFCRQRLKSRVEFSCWLFRTRQSPFRFARGWSARLDTDLPGPPLSQIGPNPQFGTHLSCLFHAHIPKKEDLPSLIASFSKQLGRKIVWQIFNVPNYMEKVKICASCLPPDAYIVRYYFH